jgi:hypothetical protein
MFSVVGSRESFLPSSNRVNLELITRSLYFLTLSDIDSSGEQVLHKLA